MARDLDQKTFKKLTLLRSPFSEIEELRERGRLLCIKLKKDPLLPEEGDVKWFFDDIELYAPKEDAAEEIKDNPKLLAWYSFEEVIWISDFYWLMPEPLKMKWDNAGLLDFILLFSLISPKPPLKASTFSSYMEALLPLKREEYRDYEVNYILENDAETMEKLVRGDIVPYYYTTHMTYNQLKTRIMTILSKQFRVKTKV